MTPDRVSHRASGSPRLAATGMWLAIAAVAGLELWLVADLELAAIGWAVHDDAMYLRSALNLLAGRWLGPFGHMTMIKGPGYPLWLSLVAWLGVPLLLAQHLLYLAACALLVLALGPWIRNRALLVLIFAVLALNPGTFSMATLRVVRAGIYPALTLLVVAGLIGLHTRAGEGWAKRLAWVVFLGLALFAFWITRVESVWILAVVVPALGTTLVVHGRTSPGSTFVLVATPVALATLLLLCVALVNERSYGIFAVSEFRSREFLRAYGALQRVSHEEFTRGIVVPREVRQRVYPVSPSFAELRPFLEGPAGRAMGAESARWLDWPAGPGELPGDWTIWALREAASAAGYYESGPRALAFYERMADEIDGACEDGRLDAGRNHASLLPPWRGAYLPLILRATPARALELLRFDQVQIGQPPSRGDDATLAKFAEVTGERLAPRAADLGGADAPHLARLRALHAVYRWLTPPLFAVALACWLAGGVAELRRRRVSFATVLAGGILCALAVRLLLLVYVDLSFFPSFRDRHLAPAWALLLLFCVTGILAAVEAHRGARAAPGAATEATP